MTVHDSSGVTGSLQIPVFPILYHAGETRDPDCRFLFSWGIPVPAGGFFWNRMEQVRALGWRARLLKTCRPGTESNRRHVSVLRSTVHKFWTYPSSPETGTQGRKQVRRRSRFIGDLSGCN